MDAAEFRFLSAQTEKKFMLLNAVDSITDVCYENLLLSTGEKYFYFKINEIGENWGECENGISQVMRSLFVGLHAVSVPFSMILKSDGVSVCTYFGIDIRSNENNDVVLRGLLQGSFPTVKLEQDKTNTAVFTFEQIVEQEKYTSGGFIKGNPSRIENKSSADVVINGLGNRQWCYIINARPVLKQQTLQRQKAFLDESSVTSELKEVSFSSTNNNENTSFKKMSYVAEKFNEKLEEYNDKYVDAMSVGEWNVTVQYGATSDSDAELLAGLMVSSLYGEESKPESVHRIKCSNIKLFEGVVVNAKSDIINKFDFPLFSNYLTSNELAIFASFPTVDTAGFAVKSHVDFDVARDKTGPLSFGKILKNGMKTESEYSLNYNELNRHCLIVGLTGSGKTNTTKNILHNVYEGSNRTLPIMVIEPAKKEYWELYKLGFDDLQIYTVGSSNPLCNPYCLNPFERIGNTALQTHIDNVYAAFKASFIMYTPMPYVLERAIYEIYEDYGWDIKTNTNTKGTDLYPTIEDLYWKIPVVVTAMGYDQKMRNDLIGSLQARINSLRLGSKGDTLNVRKSFPICEILKKNVVIELEDIGDDDVKAFIISMLLIQLVELRRQEEDCQLEVKHLLLIEEAHRLLKNVQSGSGENADPRGAAVEFFCNLLAELRSKGQGFLIADQIPSKLAPDLIKNTNIKIVHRTVDKEDRELMGGAMHMTEEQTDYLSSLKMGEAAIYSEGDNRPKLMKPNFAGSYIEDSKKHLKNEKQVLELTKNNCYLANNNPYYISLTGRNLVCRLCKPYCDKTPEQIFEFVDVKKLEEIMSLNQVATNGKITTEVLNAKFNEVLSDTNISDKAQRKYAKGCMLCHMLKQWNLGDKINENIIKTLFGN